MQSLISCFVVLLILGVLSSAQAAELATMVRHGQGGASLAFYDGTCSEEERPECVALELACARPGEFKVTIVSLSDSAAGRWLQTSKGVGRIMIGRSPLELGADRLERNELDGTWSVDLTLQQQPRAAWKAIAAGQFVSLQVGSYRVALPVGDPNAENAREVASICGG